MKYPLITIRDLYDRYDALQGQVLYVKGRYVTIGEQDGGQLTDAGQSVRVTADSRFGCYDRRYVEQRMMVHAVTLTTSDDGFSVTIHDTYRMPRLRPYLKVATRLKERLKPAVLLIQYDHDPALSDIREAMQDAYEKYDVEVITFPHVSYKEQDGKAALESVADYYLMTLRDIVGKRQWDLVCFVGSESTGCILNNDAIAAFVSRLYYSSVCAIGHADEQRSFDHAFDDSIATPSLLGVKLAELYRKYHNRSNR